MRISRVLDGVVHLGFNEEYEQVLKDAKPIDLIDEKKQVNQYSKSKELDRYQMNRDILILSEVNRLRGNAKQISVVSDFDCGPCSRCRVKDRSKCNDGYNCRKLKK